MEKCFCKLADCITLGSVDQTPFGVGGGGDATCEYVKSCGASLTICSFLNGHSYTVDNYVALTSCRIPL